MKMRSLIFLLIIFLFSPGVVFAANLLANPGFEAGDSGWNKYGSTQLRIVDNALNGTKAGTLTSDKTGAKYIYQDFETFEGEEFQLSGWVFWNDSSIANAKLKVEWYDSSSTRVGLDEVSLVSRSNEWQYSTMSIKAPPSSKTARVEAYTYLNQTNPSNPVLFDDLNFEKITSIPTPTFTSTPAPNPTPTLTSTPTPTAKPPTPTTNTTATYKINEVKDEDGEILNNVKVYVDNIYLHHYAPEVITFCESCQCDTYVNCDFGQHIIKLEKTGYEDWSKTVTINPNTSDQVSPVMVFSQTNPTPTPTKIVNPTVTPTQKINPTPTSKAIMEMATESGEILGAENEATPAFYPLEETTSSEAASLATDSGKSKFWPKFFFVVALVFLFFVSFWVWYNFRTRY